MPLFGPHRLKPLLRVIFPLGSLLLSAATIALWARASSHQDAVFCHARDSTNGLFSGQGRIVYNRAHRPNCNPDGPVFAYQHSRMQPSRWFLPQALGFALGRTIDGPTTYTGFAVPYWFITLLLLISPVTSLARRQRIRRRRRLGLCLHCGYDRRASPVRCPECGTSAQVV